VRGYQGICGCSRPAVGLEEELWSGNPGKG
jgi:hypothetical protein